MRKRLMSLVLCLAMILGMGVLPPGVFASGAAEIIVDNSDDAFSYSEGWGESVWRTGYYGTNYQSISGSSSHGAWATWSAEVETSGYYDVYVWLPKGDDSTIADAAPYTISHAAGNDTVYLSQQQTGGTWYYLASFPFLAGDTATVTLTHTEELDTAAIMADAVKFEYKAAYDGVIIDNADAEVTGSKWASSTFRNGYYGDGYLSSSTDRIGDETHEVTWKTDSLPAGNYAIYVWHPEGDGDTSISTEAPYTIRYGDSEQLVKVDQCTKGNGGQWHQISTCALKEDGPISITLGFDGVTERTAVMADAVKILPIDVQLDGNDFIPGGYEGWTETSEESSLNGTYWHTKSGDAGALLNSSFYTNVPGGYRLRFYKPSDLAVEAMSNRMEIKLDSTTYTVDLTKLADGWNTIAFCNFKSGIEHTLSIPRSVAGPAFVDALRFEYVGYDLYYTDFADASADDWTLEGDFSVTEKNLSGTSGSAYLEDTDWGSLKIDATFTAVQSVSGNFGILLGGNTQDGWMKLTYDAEASVFILSSADGSELAASEELSLHADKEYTLSINTDVPYIKVALDGEEILQAEEMRQGDIGFFSEGTNISVKEVGISQAKELSRGTYTVDLTDPQQTILGLGIEIQSDAIASGNQGLPEETNSIPHDLTQEERDRLYSEMLTGFRYMRMAGGLYYRGTDEEGKHLQERWETQNEELAELLEKSGIEGIDFEFWSPTPYFKASGGYRENYDPDTGAKNEKYGLKCFDEDWEYYGNAEKTQEFLQEFADTIVEDFQYLRDNGLPVVQFSIQNEPEWKHDTGYSHCYYNADMYYQTAKVVLPTVHEAFPDIHIHADSLYGQYSSRSKELIKDPELLALVDGWTHHYMGSDSNVQIDQADYLNSNKGRDDIVVYNTEFEYLDGKTSDWRCINTAQSIMNWMTFENSPIWHWLHALKPLGNSEAEGYSLGFWRKPGDDSTYSEKYNHIQEGEWDYNYQNWNAIRGFLKYMPWDSVRYTVDEDEVRYDQRIMAWKTPEGQLVIALTNRSTDDAFQFDITTGLDATFHGYRYTPSGKEEIALESQTGTTISPLLPPLSIEFWVQEADDTMIMANGVEISNTNLTLGVNGTAQLTAEVQPDNAANKNVRWTSSDSTIVKVDENGNITALKEGTATVTATAISGSGRYSADCVVTVDTSIPVDKYTVTVNNSYAETSGAGTYQPGQQVTVQAGSRSGYRFDGWTVEGVTISDSSSETVTFTMPSGNVTFTANWSSIGGGSSSSSGDYSISMNTGSNGKISVSPSRADKGDTVTITVKPDSGYVLDTLTVTDKNGDSVKLTEKDENRYTFTMPASKVTVKATFTAETQESDLPFTDVSAEDYFYDAVRWAVENNITTGTSAAAFSPSAACTRAQMVTFLWRAAGCPAPKSTSNPFTDVEESDYCYEAVLWAVENGITAGTSATTFSPDAVVTRGQTVTFLYRYDGASAAADADFTDVSEDAYYYDAVQWAAESGITTGTTATTFSPDAACTRGQIVTFLFRDLAE